MWFALHRLYCRVKWLDNSVGNPHVNVCRASPLVLLESDLEGYVTWDLEGGSDTTRIHFTPVRSMQGMRCCCRWHTLLLIFWLQLQMWGSQASWYSRWAISSFSLLNSWPGAPFISYDHLIIKVEGWEVVRGKVDQLLTDRTIKKIDYYCLCEVLGGSESKFICSIHQHFQEVQACYLLIKLFFLYYMPNTLYNKYSIHTYCKTTDFSVNSSLWEK